MFLELAHEFDEPTLIDLRRNQYGIHRMIAPSFKDLEFERGIAARWWPLGQRRRVVLDPKRSFGKPVDDEFGVPVEALSATLDTLGSVREVSRWYEVNPKAVKSAKLYSESLSI